MNMNPGSGLVSQYLLLRQASNATKVFPFHLNPRNGSERKSDLTNWNHREVVASSGHDTFEPELTGIDDGDVKDGFEFAQEAVGQEGTKERGEVREEDKGVVDDGSHVLHLLAVLPSGLGVQVFQVQRQDGCCRRVEINFFFQTLQ